MMIRQKNTAYLNKNSNLCLIRGEDSVSSLSSIALFLLKRKAEGLLKGVLISDSLISEIDSFVDRNNVITPLNGMMHAVCKDCLKAHAMKKASELGLDQRSIDFIDSVLDGKFGHYGYYMDKDNLIKF